MILYLNGSKNSTQKLDTVNSYSKVAGYKINLQKSLVSPYTINEQNEKGYMEAIPFILASKKIKYLGINLGKDENELYKGELQTPEERHGESLLKVERSPMLMDWQNQHSKMAYYQKQCTCLIQFLSKSKWHSLQRLKNLP
jgi:hypothetical protein